MAESASSLTCISLSISHREINILYQNNQQSSLQNFIPTKDMTSPQDIIPDLLFQSFLATTGIIWPLHLSPELTRKKKKQDLTRDSGVLVRATACRNDFPDGPSRQEKCCSQLHSRRYFAGDALLGGAKQCWCQTIFVTVLTST